MVTVGGSRKSQAAEDAERRMFCLQCALFAALFILGVAAVNLHLQPAHIAAPDDSPYVRDGAAALRHAMDVDRVAREQREGAAASAATAGHVCRVKLGIDANDDDLCGAVAWACRRKLWRREPCCLCKACRNRKEWRQHSLRWPAVQCQECHREEYFSHLR